MKQLISQILLFVLAAAVLSVARNEVAPGGIEWVGDWAERDSVLAAVAADPSALPPSADEDDPPFLNLPQAMAKFGQSGVVFIDAREPEEYAAGHIGGARLLPFDYFDEYWPFFEANLPLDADIVTYCSGAECELSLFLARHLRTLGYQNISIFFGGWVQWQENGGPMDTGEDTSHLGL